MARPLRIRSAAALYHVTARGNHRQPIDGEDRDRERFLDRLADMVRTQRLRVHTLALIRNRDHLLVDRPEAQLARPMGHLDSTNIEHFNRRHRRRMARGSGVRAATAAGGDGAGVGSLWAGAAREIGSQFGVRPHAVSKASAQVAALPSAAGRVGRASEQPAFQLTSSFKA